MPFTRLNIMRMVKNRENEIWRTWEVGEKTLARVWWETLMG